MTNLSLASQSRQVEFPVNPIFPNRWSPRAMSAEPIAPETLNILLEAARWAPSANNGQPWRFAYAFRNTETFSKYFDLLVPGNQVWCKHAGILMIIASQIDFAATERHPAQLNRSHSFDAGAAWMNLALQGSMLGLVVHGMGGFDISKAGEVAQLPAGYLIEAMCAIGYPDSPESLPESLRSREIPTPRNPISKFAAEGFFP